jgi:hypothetical protein
MPLETGYAQRTTPQDPAPMPLPTPASQGAAIGEGLSELGTDVNTSQLQAYKVQRSLQADQQATAFDNNFSQIRQGMDSVVAAARQTSDPGAPNHTATVMQALNAQKDQLFSGITDLKVQQHASQQWDSYASSLASTESTWQSGQQVGKAVADVSNANENAANRVQTNPDRAAFQQEIAQRYTAIDALTGVPGDVKDKLRLQAGEKVSTGYLNGVIQSNPAGAISMLDKGLFDDILTNEQRETLHKSAEVEQNKQLVLARQQNTAAEKKYHMALSTAEKQAGQGIDVTAQLPQLAAQAKAFGDTDGMATIQGLQGQSQFSKVWTVATPLQRQQRVETLSGEQNPSQQDQMELHWLKEKGPALDAQFNADPAGFLMKNGHQAPPITDGAGRFQWSQAQTQASVAAGGRPVPPLSAQETESLKTLKASGLQGSNATLATLDQFPGGAPRAAVAQQVAPDDLVYQHVAQLDQNTRGTVLAGAQVLKDNADFFGKKPQQTTAGTLSVAGPAETIMSPADARLKVALKLIDPKQVDAITNVSRQFTAGLLTHIGQGANAVTPHVYDQAQRAALGGKTVGGVAYGGLGDWGGDGTGTGKPVILPDGSTNASFANGVRNYLTRVKPTNPDGSPLNIASLTPVFTGSNTYVFEGPDGRLAADAKHKTIRATITGTYSR